MIHPRCVLDDNNNHSKPTQNKTSVYFSVHSTTCFGLTDHRQVDQEYKTV